MIKKIILIVIYLFVCSCTGCDSNPPTSSTLIIGCIDASANNYNPNANTDDGSCNYDSTSDHPTGTLWFVTNGDGTWGIGYNSGIEIGGFQITINGSTTMSVVSGGDAQNYGFSISVNEGSGIILGFSFSGATIPEGSGILFSIESDGIPTVISNIIIADSAGDPINFTFDEGTFFSMNMESTREPDYIYSDSITDSEVRDEMDIVDTGGLTNYNNFNNEWVKYLSLSIHLEILEIKQNL